MQRKKALAQLAVLQQAGGSFRLAGECWDADWKTLIAILLSARTMDEVTIPVAEQLFKQYATLAALAKARSSSVEKLIKSINFYRNKTKHVLGCAKALLANFDGEVPRTIEELVTLPGVGRKTANVFLSETGGTGIGVDTHVGRISYKLKWTRNTDPVKIEHDLKTLFPEERWNEVNTTLIKFGKQFFSKKKEDEVLKQLFSI